METSKSKINFFSSYFEYLEDLGIVNVILHSYEHYPEQISSDVDYCVSEEMLLRIPQMVYDYCELSGWQLVQILQHEVNAYYCVCVSIDNPSDCVKLDVCSDYVRDGKKLINGAELLNDRALSEQGFYIPSPVSEFHYILWKTAAKAKGCEATSVRLSELYQQNVAACDELLDERGVKAKNIDFKMAEVYEILTQKYEVLGIVSRLFESKRLLDRVINPSGLILEINSEKEVEGDEFIALIETSMLDSFRSVMVKENKVTLREGIKILRSALIICKRPVLMNLTRGIMKNRNAYLAVDCESVNTVVQQVNQFLADRVQARWKLI